MIYKDSIVERHIKGELQRFENFFFEDFPVKKVKEHHKFILKNMLEGDSVFFHKYRCCGFSTIALYYMALNAVIIKNFQGFFISPFENESQRVIKLFETFVKEINEYSEITRKYSNKLDINIGKDLKSSVTFTNLEQLLSPSNHPNHYAGTEYDLTVLDEVGSRSLYQIFNSAIPRTTQFLGGVSPVDNVTVKDIKGYFNCSSWNNSLEFKNFKINKYIKLHYMMDPDLWDEKWRPTMAACCGENKFKRDFECI